MKSKVLLLALATTAFALTSKAQDAKTTFGIRAGVNFQNLNGELGGEDLEFKMKTGFHIGANAEIPVATDFYLQPGLLFSTKGAKAEEGDGKFNLSYIEVPVSFIYKPTLGAGKLILGVGPYVGFGIGGKIKGDGEDVDIKFSNDLDQKEATEFANGDAWYMKGLDFGGNLTAGYELSSKLSFQLNAQLGMSNLFPKIDGEKVDNTKIKNTGFGISVGYRF
ncbi:porin family protein [Longitalea arenae]|uniref:porin family protein n=1 Tax=Longitalea arenae TaxID=2812558 RepID=UPI0019677667|nr:porin family protein [Longitalea arenae]